jgi:Zinc knuckle
MVKFRRGLFTQIQNAVATMASGRPSDTDPARWYEMARTVDENRATNEAFQSAYRAPAPSVPNAHILPTPGNPIPMDIDLARRRELPSALCSHCGKPGHLSKECPDRFDVWTLSVDELQALLKDRLAQLNVATTENKTVPTSVWKSGHETAKRP